MIEFNSSSISFTIINHNQFITIHYSSAGAWPAKYKRPSASKCKYFPFKGAIREIKRIKLDVSTLLGPHQYTIA